MAKQTESSLVRARTELAKLPTRQQEAVRSILTEDTTHDAYRTVNYFEVEEIEVAELVLKHAEAVVRSRKAGNKIVFATGPGAAPGSGKPVTA